MEFPPQMTPELARQMQEMAEQARARHKMNLVVHDALAYATRYAQHRDSLWTPPPGCYDLAEFLLRTQTMSKVHAESHLFEPMAEAPTKDVHVVIVVPSWVNTVRGHGNPELHEPNWVPVWQTPVNGHAALHFPKTANAVALAAYGRHPSLLRVDWDWVGIYPFATPAYNLEAIPTVEARPCVEDTCDEDEGQAAA